MQKTDKIDEYDRIWPTRSFYAPDGKLIHLYTRCEKPNLKNMSTHYRCKSYRTYHCPARLQFFDKNGKPEFIPSKNVHTEECKANTGIKPANAV
jgi:hypothetical protein